MPSHRHAVAHHRHGDDHRRVGIAAWNGRAEAAGANSPALVISGTDVAPVMTASPSPRMRLMLFTIRFGASRSTRSVRPTSCTTRAPEWVM